MKCFNPQMLVITTCISDPGINLPLSGTRLVPRLPVQAAPQWGADTFQHGPIALTFLFTLQLPSPAVCAHCHFKNSAK